MQIDPRPQIIIGPPGTGKTTTLLGIVREELAAGCPPDRLGFVSFTRRAATEAQERAGTALGLTKKDLPYFRTLHSLCMRWLALPTGSVMEGDRMQEFAEWIGERIEGRASLDDGTWAGYGRGDRMLFMDGLSRIRRVPLREVYEQGHDDLDWLAVERFARGLRQFKAQHLLYDYTDMLELFVARGEAPRIEVLLVDEAQDLSLIQWEVVRLLARNARRVVVAGDDDQCVFRWAGADVDTFIDLPGDVTVLGQSHRVPRAVQTLAHEVIGRVTKRRPKAWAPRDEEGRLQRLSHPEEVDWAGDSVMLLARNRYQLYPIANLLKASGIVYELQGHSSVREPVRRAIVTWERLRQGQSQPVPEVLKVYEQMSMNVGWKRGHKKLPGFAEEQLVTLQDLRERGGLLRSDPWYDALDALPVQDRAYILRCRRNGERLSTRPRVRLTTVHASKGGEADKVVLLTDLAPRTFAEARVAPEDEARVWYVAATRARQELCILRPSTRMAYAI